MTVAVHQWQVHKFGGASVQDAEGIRNAGKLIQQITGYRLVIVISAMGKTTSALENVARLGWQHQVEEAKMALELIRVRHLETANHLGLQGDNQTILSLDKEFEAIRDRLSKPIGQDFDPYYDFIVHRGEVLATLLSAAYFCQIGLNVQWHDSRTLVYTDNTHREARVNWPRTTSEIKEKLSEGLSDIHVVQGFIGKGEHGQPVTLGLEGSDFSAAIFANALNAVSVTLWKNVAGVFSADPAYFPAAELLPRLSYLEVFQMANYGAKVIHPKTMHPLEQAAIPLQVRSFLDPSAQGTDIGPKEPDIPYPPIQVRLEGLMLISLHLSDLSYFSEYHIDQVFSILRSNRAKACLTEIGLVNFSVAIQVSPERKSALIQQLSEHFRLKYNEQLALLTVRHYQEERIREQLKGREIYLEQRNRQTMQVLYK